MSSLVEYLHGEFQSLLSEATRRNLDLKEFIERTFNGLSKMLKNSADPENTLSGGELDVFQPLLLICQCKINKLVVIGVGCLKKLITHKAFIRLPILEKILIVFNQLVESSNSSSEVSLKIIQSFLPLLSNYKSIHKKNLVLIFGMCFRLVENKSPVISSSSSATLRQLIVYLFERMEKMEPLNSEPLSKSSDEPNQPITKFELQPYTFDAYYFFKDLCSLSNGDYASFLELKFKGPSFILELIELVLSNYPESFKNRPEFLNLLKGSLCNSTIHKFKTLSQDYQLSLRLFRIVGLILREFPQALIVECEMFLCLLIKIVSISQVLWQKVLALEVLRGIFHSFHLIKLFYFNYDYKRDNAHLFQELFNYFEESLTHYASLTQNEALSLNSPLIKNPWIDQLEKTEAPSVKDSSVHLVVFQCIILFIRGICDFVLPFYTFINTLDNKSAPSNLLQLLDMSSNDPAQPSPTLCKSPEPRLLSKQRTSLCSYIKNLALNSEPCSHFCKSFAQAFHSEFLSSSDYSLCKEMLSSYWYRFQSLLFILYNCKLDDYSFKLLLFSLDSLLSLLFLMECKNASESFLLKWSQNVSGYLLEFLDTQSCQVTSVGILNDLNSNSSSSSSNSNAKKNILFENKTQLSLCFFFQMLLPINEALEENSWTHWLSVLLLVEKYRLLIETKNFSCDAQGNVIKFSLGQSLNLKSIMSSSFLPYNIMSSHKKSPLPTSTGSAASSLSFAKMKKLCHRFWTESLDFTSSSFYLFIKVFANIIQNSLITSTSNSNTNTTNNPSSKTPSVLPPENLFLLKKLKEIITGNTFRFIDFGYLIQQGTTSNETLNWLCKKDSYDVRLYETSIGLLMSYCCHCPEPNLRLEILRLYNVFLDSYIGYLVSKGLGFYPQCQNFILSPLQKLLQDSLYLDSKKEALKLLLVALINYVESWTLGWRLVLQILNEIIVQDPLQKDSRPSLYTLPQSSQVSLEEPDIQSSNADFQDFSNLKAGIPFESTSLKNFRFESSSVSSLQGTVLETRSLTNLYHQPQQEQDSSDHLILEPQDSLGKLSTLANDSQNLITFAFPCLQFISVDCLVYFDKDYILECIKTIGIYALNSPELNLTLTCMGLLWNVSDEIQRRQIKNSESSMTNIPQNTSSKADSQSSSLSPPLLLVSCQRADLSELIQALLKQLLSISYDTREEVKEAAIQILLRIITLHGKNLDLTEWEYIFVHVLFVLLDSIIVENGENFNADLAKRQCLESQNVLFCIVGLGNLLIEFSLIFLSLEESLLQSLWRRYFDKLLYCIKFGSDKIRDALLKEFNEIICLDFQKKSVPYAYFEGKTQANDLEKKWQALLWTSWEFWESLCLSLNFLFTNDMSNKNVYPFSQDSLWLLLVCHVKFMRLLTEEALTEEVLLRVLNVFFVLLTVYLPPKEVFCDVERPVKYQAQILDFIIELPRLFPNKKYVRCYVVKTICQILEFPLGRLSGFMNWSLMIENTQMRGYCTPTLLGLLDFLLAEPTNENRLDKLLNEYTLHSELLYENNYILLYLIDCFCFSLKYKYEVSNRNPLFLSQSLSAQQKLSSFWKLVLSKSMEIINTLLKNYYENYYACKFSKAQSGALWPNLQVSSKGSFFIGLFSFELAHGDYKESVVDNLWNYIIKFIFHTFQPPLSNKIINPQVDTPSERHHDSTSSKSCNNSKSTQWFISNQKNDEELLVEFCKFIDSSLRKWMTWNVSDKFIIQIFRIILIVNHISLVSANQNLKLPKKNDYFNFDNMAEAFSLISHCQQDFVYEKVLSESTKSPSRAEEPCFLYYREKLALACWNVIFNTISSNNSHSVRLTTTTKPESPVSFHTLALNTLRISRICFSLFIKRCEQIFANYIQAKKSTGNFPLSRVQSNEINFLLKNLYELNILDNIVDVNKELFLGSSPASEVEQPSESLTHNDEHLYILYPYFIECLNYRETTVIYYIQKILLRIGKSLKFNYFKAYKFE